MCLSLLPFFNPRLKMFHFSSLPFLKFFFFLYFGALFPDPRSIRRVSVEFFESDPDVKQEMKAMEEQKKGWPVGIGMASFWPWIVGNRASEFYPFSIDDFFCHQERSCSFLIISDSVDEVVMSRWKREIFVVPWLNSIRPVWKSDLLSWMLPTVSLHHQSWLI
uniref:UPF0133 protein Ccon26_18480 n=1 Tax=Anthurium amnicola TaxID=1678845 RepID=A0A1D1YTV2_9ARAE